MLATKTMSDEETGRLRRAADQQDRELIARIRDEDQTALQDFFVRHRTGVFRFIVRLVRNEAVAEEITNEVFLEVWRHASRYEGRSAVTTWLLTIARNRAVSALRKRREASWDEDKAAELEDDGDTPEVTAQKTDKAAALRDCIGRLSADHSEIIDLVYFQEKSVGEVAEIVGIPDATVKTRLFYARKKLSEFLKEAGIDRGWP